MSEPLVFKADLVSIFSLFHGKSYSIPVFQRDYAWEKEQLQQLWDDLDHFDSQDPPEHFLGPIILIPAEDVFHNALSEYQVVDGQQRITTLQLLVAAIRDRWIQLGDPSHFENGMEIKSKSVVEGLVYATAPTVRFTLTPNRFLKDIFFDYVQKQPGAGQKDLANRKELKANRYIDHAQDLVNAVKFVRGKLSKFDETRLRKFQQYLLHSVKVLSVEAGGAANAFLLFETLNYRGLELSQSDLAKSYVFSKIPSEYGQSQFIEKWDEAMTNLGKTSPDTFLRHWLSLRHGRTLKKDIFVQIKGQVHDEQSALALVADICESSRLYALIVRNEFLADSSDELVDLALEELSELRVDTQAIFLLAALEQFLLVDGAENRKVLLDLLQITQTLSMRWSTCGKNAQELENTYQQAAVDVLEGTARGLKAAKKRLISAMPSNELFLAELENSYIKQNTRAGYILRKLENHKMKSGAFVISGPNRVHVEHVAPQRPSSTSNWRSQMEGESTYQECIYMLGNLTLLPKKLNLEASNKPFKEKLKLYKAQDSKDGLQLPSYTRDLLAEKAWTQDAVIKRTRKLAKAALKVWPLPTI